MPLAVLLAQQTTQPEPTNPASSLFLFVPLILVFYLFVLRPQRRRMQQHHALVASIEPGDEVETVGGMFGTVGRIEDDVMWVEVSAGTTVKVSRAAVRRKVVPPDAE